MMEQVYLKETDNAGFQAAQREGLLELGRHGDPAKTSTAFDFFVERVDGRQEYRAYSHRGLETYVGVIVVTP